MLGFKSTYAEYVDFNKSLNAYLATLGNEAQWLKRCSVALVTTLATEHRLCSVTDSDTDATLIRLVSIMENNGTANRAPVRPVQFLATQVVAWIISKVDDKLKRMLEGFVEPLDLVTAIRNTFRVRRRQEVLKLMARTVDKIRDLRIRRNRRHLALFVQHNYSLFRDLEVSLLDGCHALLGVEDINDFEWMEESEGEECFQSYFVDEGGNEVEVVEPEVLNEQELEGWQYELELLDGGTEQTHTSTVASADRNTSASSRPSTAFSTDTSTQPTTAPQATTQTTSNTSSQSPSRSPSADLIPDLIPDLITRPLNRGNPRGSSPDLIQRFNPRTRERSASSEPSQVSPSPSSTSTTSADQPGQRHTSPGAPSGAPSLASRLCPPGQRPARPSNASQSSQTTQSTRYSPYPPTNSSSNSSRQPATTSNVSSEPPSTRPIPTGPRKQAPATNSTNPSQPAHTAQPPVHPNVQTRSTSTPTETTNTTNPSTNPSTNTNPTTQSPAPSTQQNASTPAPSAPSAPPAPLTPAQIAAKLRQQLTEKTSSNTSSSPNSATLNSTANGSDTRATSTPATNTSANAATDTPPAAPAAQAAPAAPTAPAADTPPAAPTAPAADTPPPTTKTPPTAPAAHMLNNPSPSLSIAPAPFSFTAPHGSAAPPPTSDDLLKRLETLRNAVRAHSAANHSAANQNPPGTDDYIKAVENNKRLYGELSAELAATPLTDKPRRQQIKRDRRKVNKAIKTWEDYLRSTCVVGKYAMNQGAENANMR